jgi:hypothetical protein
VRPPEPAAKEEPPKPVPEAKAVVESKPPETTPKEAVKAPETPAAAAPREPAPAALRPFRLSVLDGFRLGIGLALAGVVVGLLYVGGFWVAGRVSKSVRKEWHEAVDKTVAKTMADDFTVPNDSFPPMPDRIRALKTGKVWQGAKRGAHIVVTSHSFLANAQEEADIQEYLRAGQWVNYAKNTLYVLVDLSQSKEGGSEIEFKPGKTLRILMSDGQRFVSADLVKARKEQKDQSPWDPLKARLGNLEAMFGEGAVQPGGKATFVAFMPEGLDLNKVQEAYWHFTEGRRLKLMPYER